MAATFAGNTVYTSTIVLTAASGYEFASGFNATNIIGIPSGAEEVVVTGHGASITITITYAKTAA